jgi:hypothetical protein
MLAQGRGFVKAWVIQAPPTRRIAGPAFGTHEPSVQPFPHWTWAEAGEAALECPVAAV